MSTHRHTEDSKPSEDPNTGPRKILAKSSENVMFYHLGGGVSAPRTSMDFKYYYIFEDTRVLGCICNWGGGGEGCWNMVVLTKQIQHNWCLLSLETIHIYYIKNLLNYLEKMYVNFHKLMILLWKHQEQGCHQHQGLTEVSINQFPCAGDGEWFLQSPSSASGKWILTCRFPCYIFEYSKTPILSVTTLHYDYMVIITVRV